jgi:hypothetical protein
MTKKKDPEPKKTQPSEFIEDPHYYVVFSTNGLQLGRMIAESKSDYCVEHQGELVIFNANVIIKSVGKIWYGDLNINLDFDSLKNIADQLGEDLYVLMEGDARFGYENDPIQDLIKRAKVTIKCNKCKEIEKKSASKPKTKKKKDI